MTLSGCAKQIAAANAGECFEFRCAVHVSWPRAAELFPLGRFRTPNDMTNQENQNTDWSYMRGGKYVGLTTLKARFKWMPADQVEQAKTTMADP